MFLLPPLLTLFPYTTLFRSAFGFDQFSTIDEFGSFDFAAKSLSSAPAVRSSLSQDQLDSIVSAAIERTRSEDPRLNSSDQIISCAVFCLKKKKKNKEMYTTN